MFHEIKQQLKEITNQGKTLAATNVAKHLAPLVGLTSKPSMQNTEAHADTGLAVPNIPSEPPTNASCTPNTSADERDASSLLCQQLPYTKELLTSSEITPIYTKSRNRRNC